MGGLIDLREHGWEALMVAAVFGLLVALLLLGWGAGVGN